MSAVFGITGWKNSGKTTLVARLVTVFTERGYRVSTLKHAHESFDIDHEGTDSFAHRAAGASEVALVSARRWAVMHEVDEDDTAPTLKDMLARMSPCDLILVEGFKREDFPKIECIRGASQRDEAVWKNNPTIVGLARDAAAKESGAAAPALPDFDLDDVNTIADFIATHCTLPLRVDV